MNIKAYRTTYGDNQSERIVRRQKYKETCRRIRAEEKEAKEKTLKKQKYAKKRKPLADKLAIGKEWLEIRDRSPRGTLKFIIEETCQRYDVKADTVRKYARMYKKSIGGAARN